MTLSGFFVSPGTSSGSLPCFVHFHCFLILFPFNSYLLAEHRVLLALSSVHLCVQAVCPFVATPQFQGKEQFLTVAVELLTSSDSYSATMPLTRDRLPSLPRDLRGSAVGSTLLWLSWSWLPSATPRSSQCGSLCVQAGLWVLRGSLLLWCVRSSS